MKQTLRNLSFFSVISVAFIATTGGCSDEATTPIGAGNFPTSSGSSSGGSSAGTFGASGSATGGSGNSGSATGGTGTAGTFGTSGTTTGGTGTAGTFGTSGTATGGGGAGGAGGVAAGGGGAGGVAAGGGGAGGGASTDFPANCPAPTGTHGATPLTRSCWGAKANECAATGDNMNPPVQAIDAAGETTRFSTGAKMLTSQAFTFELDLGSEVMVNGVKVTSKDGTLDYAPQLQIATSTDGTTFTPVACGTGGVITDFSFTAKAAKYVRIIQHGVADGWWSVHDLNVYASTGDTCAGGGTQTNVCTTPHTN